MHAEFSPSFLGNLTWWELTWQGETGIFRHTHPDQATLVVLQRDIFRDHRGVRTLWRLSFWSEQRKEDLADQLWIHCPRPSHELGSVAHDIFLYRSAVSKCGSKGYSGSTNFSHIISGCMLFVPMSFAMMSPSLNKMPKMLSPIVLLVVPLSQNGLGTSTGRSVPELSSEIL